MEFFFDFPKISKLIDSSDPWRTLFCREIVVFTMNLTMRICCFRHLQWKWSPIYRRYISLSSEVATDKQILLFATPYLQNNYPIIIWTPQISSTIAPNEWKVYLKYYQTAHSLTSQIRTWPCAATETPIKKRIACIIKYRKASSHSLTFLSYFNKFIIWNPLVPKNFIVKLWKKKNENN